eukprot:CAMPEP_0119320298 /NCGR_PEP_ID=MMETSP1333-20130426/52113_1 /TAXON_ID=418940 /ORGANISM="Scyphosphaera apsteinii, Strain RCC1455" /LENGTH=1000 /DNA_ID=CAMNT_0007326993 /DNA_START=77 /DNA_END=3079 /DNA_ORIENTATION=+
MAGIDFDLLACAFFFLFAVWMLGRLFRICTLPSILGELFAGILLGPHFLDIVPFASDGTCDTVLFEPRDYSGSTEAGSSPSHGRALAGADQCKEALRWMPRWGSSMLDTPDIWSFAGTVGVTLLIMESGMHINFEKVRQIGGRALIVAIIGTATPMIIGMLLVAGLYPGNLYPGGFAAGCALAPTSVGISIKLLGDAKMLNSMAGQTTLTAAFVDDVFSLVLLVLLSSLSSGNTDPGLIILRTLAAFTFLGFGVLGGKNIYPRLSRLLDNVRHIKGASIQPRDEVHLVIMIASLVFYAWLGSLIGSHLLGAFVAGMCFVSVPRSHQVWVAQLKRIIRWLIRIFFAATVGFAVPLQEMLTVDAFTKGLALGAVPGILCKVVSGLPARMSASPNERARAKKASIMTRFGIQPIQYLVGMAMVARGEFAFLVAYSARNMKMPNGNSYMLQEEIYAALTWALVWALVLAPFLFKWALAVFMRASPIQRANSIGGCQAAERNFVIQVIGLHHAGVLHEVLNAIHGEGMDVLECRTETDGDVDTNYFVVQSRGKQKDFDDEKLEDIRHHIKEILGDENAVVMFESVGDDQATFAAMEIQVVTETAENANVVSHMTKRLQELGLDVEEIDEHHKLQMTHGHETDMEVDLFYAVPSQLLEDETFVITQVRVNQVKRSLQSTLRDEGIKAELVVKPVADRTKGFSELQTFDPQKAITRAKGTVWELICLGSHNVEMLSTAVRKLTPLGLRLLHAAHTHAHNPSETDVQQSQCSRFFVEKPGQFEAPSDDEVQSFSAKVRKVLMTTYKTDDESKFLVWPVSAESLKTMKSPQDYVPGLQDLTEQHVRLSASLTDAKGSIVGLMRHIPDRPAVAREKIVVADEASSTLGLPISSGNSSHFLSSSVPKRGGDRGAPELEARIAQLEGLLARVERLETLELQTARNSFLTTSTLGLPIPRSPGRNQSPKTTRAPKSPSSPTSHPMSPKGTDAEDRHIKLNLESSIFSTCTADS